MKEKIVVLYQGECLFCNWCRCFLEKRDIRKVFKFVAIKSEEGIALIQEHTLHITIEHPDSIVVIVPEEEPKYKWQACLELLHQASWVLMLLRVLLLPIPLWLGNRIYDCIGRHRGLLCRIVRC